MLPHSDLVSSNKIKSTILCKAVLILWYQKNENLCFVLKVFRPPAMNKTSFLSEAVKSAEEADALHSDGSGIKFQIPFSKAWHLHSFPSPPQIIGVLLAKSFPVAPLTPLHKVGRSSHVTLEEFSSKLIISTDFLAPSAQPDVTRSLVIAKNKNNCFDLK